MRLLTRSKLYRAFPELDPFPDEQCERFVRAARQAWDVRIWHWLLIAGSVLLGAVLALTALIYVGNTLEKPSHRGIWPYLILTLVSIPVLGLVPLAGYTARDWLLRRRVRRVLAFGGSCRRCRYGLVGLPVDERCVVVCPECGLETAVDVSLGELSRDAGGGGRYTPNVRTVTPPPGFLSPAQGRRLLGLTVRVALAVFVLAGSGWGVHEYLLRVQAARAAAGRVSAEAMNTWIESSRPSLASGAADGWAILEEVHALRTRTGRRLFGEDFSDSLPGGTIYDLALRSGEGVQEWHTPEQIAQMRAQAFALIEAYGKEDLFGKLARLDTAGAGGTFTPADDQPLAHGDQPRGESLWAIYPITAASLRMAIARGDDAEFLAVAGGYLALGRFLRASPITPRWRAIGATELEVYSCMFAWLATHPEAGWIRELGRLLDRHEHKPGLEYLLRGEEMLVADELAWAFADLSHVRFGPYSPWLARTYGERIRGCRLGSYRENHDLVRAFFEQQRRLAAALPWRREALAVTFSFPTGLALLDHGMLSWAARGVLEGHDRGVLMTAGLRVAAALELYRHACGDYPETLGELEALFPEEGLRFQDPWSNGPLRYIRIDPSRDPQGRAFLLYSVGVDGRDDHAAQGPDTVVNDARWRAW